MTQTVVLPKKLTAENGAKYLLLGEFYSEVVVSCEDCYGDDDSCHQCKGSGSITMRVPVSWTTIKAIYDKIVKHMAMQV